MARPQVSEPVRWWIAAPLLAAILFFAPTPAWVVDDFFSRDMYPWLQRALTTVTNLVDFAVLDVLIVLVVLALCYRLVRLLFVAATGGPIDAIWEGVRRGIRALGIIALAFMLAWGCNYRRIPLEATLGAGNEPASLTTEALLAAVTEADALAAALRASHPAGSEMTYELAAQQLPGPMNAALEELNRTPLWSPGRPKVSRILTPFFTLAGVNGLVNPFALESIVHPDLVPVERPFVLAHEWAHLSGHADEAEANAVAWLACMKGGPELVYSASVYLIMEAGGALPEAEWSRAFAALDPGVRADIRLIAQRTLRQNPEVQRAASRVYDEYLRANRVADGTKSYSRALTLILAPPFRSVLEGHKKGLGAPGLKPRAPSS
jgi:hypothetical protein